MGAWEEVRWIAEAHPGRRVWGLCEEEEGVVSPASADTMLAVAPRVAAASIGFGEGSCVSNGTCDSLLKGVLLRSSRRGVGGCCTLQ